MSGWKRGVASELQSPSNSTSHQVSLDVDCQGGALRSEGRADKLYSPPQGLAGRVQETAHPPCGDAAGPSRAGSHVVGRLHDRTRRRLLVPLAGRDPGFRGHSRAARVAIDF
jgi:hypothetical protein